MTLRSWFEAKKAAPLRELQWIALGVGYFALALVCCFDSIRNNDIGLDFRCFLLAGRAVRGGLDLYDASVLDKLAAKARLGGHTYPYLYPPILAEVLAPFSAARVRSAQLEWTIASMALLSTALTAFVRTVTRALGRGAAGVSLPISALGGLLFWVLPFRNNMELGQANPIVLAFVLFGVAAYFERRDAAAGALIAVAACIKITPVVLIVFFLARRRWRAAASCVAAGVAFGLGSMAIFGWTPWAQFIAKLPELAPGGVISGMYPPDVLYSFALSAYFSRWIADAPNVVRALSAVAAAGLVGLAAWSASGAKDDRSELLALSALFPTMVVVAPIAYLHHVLYALPTVALLVADAAVRERRVRLFALLTLAGALSLDWPTFCIGRHLTHLGAALLGSPNLFGLIALYVIARRSTSDGVQRSHEGETFGGI